MKEKENAAPHVYQAIAKVMAVIGKEGIAKDRKNDQQGYNFRGIDDVYNALAPILSEAQLCILPAVRERQVLERQTRSGGALFYVTVDVEFALVSAVDGSTHTIRVVGEAMDSGDKATNKAMSAAYKYACMQTFCIPTEGDNDADKTTHEVAPKTVAKIGTNELTTITRLASATKTELSAIAEAYGISSINELPLSKTAEVVARLQNKATKTATATASQE